MHRHGRVVTLRGLPVARWHRGCSAVLTGKQTDFAPVWASFHARAASPQGIPRLKRESPGVRRRVGG
jgi:hypothetical protein